MFKIIVITPETNHLHEADILHTLVLDYNCTIHIRKPNFNLAEYETYLQKYNQLLPHFVLHEHHSLAKYFPVKGIHLKESDRKSVKEIPKDVKVISTSLHTIHDVKNILHGFEYFFFSPLFESISKQNYGCNNTYEVLKETVLELNKITSIPIIGLGGINEENIALVKNSGFDGAALLGAIWQSEEPLMTYNKIYSCLLKSRNTRE